MTEYDASLSAYFAEPAGVLRWEREALSRLPDDFRPTHFGLGERPIWKSANAIENRERFEAFLSAHQCGWLYGDGFAVDVTVFDDLWSEICVWGTTADPRLRKYGRQLFETWDRYGAVYGYGAETAERRARNGYKVHLASGGTSEGWFGRDMRRYVPGLYWLNYFSWDYLNEHPLNLEAIARDLEAQVFPADRGFVLQLYERPDEWRAKLEDVQRVIDRTPGMFSRTGIEVPQGLPGLEHLAWAERIFRQWP